MMVSHHESSWWIVMTNRHESPWCIIMMIHHDEWLIMMKHRVALKGFLSGLSWPFLPWPWRFFQGAFLPWAPFCHGSHGMFPSRDPQKYTYIPVECPPKCNSKFQLRKPTKCTSLLNASMLMPWRIASLSSGRLASQSRMSSRGIILSFGQQP